MSFQGKSLLDLSTLETPQILSLFELASKIEKQGWNVVSSHVNPSFAPLVALVFLEASTRTTMSFEVAAAHCGFRVMKLFGEGSSTKKGETLLDTLLTLNAMKQDLFVVRHGMGEKLHEIAPQLNAPVINAGEGVSGHPTQALLDAYTILKERGQLKGERVLIVGDVAHSRVAASNIELLEKFGAEVAICGPKEWGVKNKKLKIFGKLSEGLEWATVAKALRIQHERMGKTTKSAKLQKDLIKKYQLNKKSLAHLRSDAIIMHPGPFNREVEISSEVLDDSRCRIWNQVANGVFIRGALMAKILGVVK